MVYRVPPVPKVQLHHNLCVPLVSKVQLHRNLCVPSVCVKSRMIVANRRKTTQKLLFSVIFAPKVQFT